ncbi:LuxR C-terminal-related transcriptional regulator [Nocardia aurantiaca]|uniref:LuxR C-terminal-related transcriptional regulator n=1 Tax=Nocardia aurantiaca TaxID=2675850 RepID=UPI0018A9AC8E|nr:LuxR C-terminal-related transcriptional regulator [Nocardia aurantiaca]
MSDVFSYRVSTLTGRHAEVAELRRLLHEPGIRLLTVTGLAGVGKSRLVTEALATPEYHEIHTPTVDLSEVSSAMDTWRTVLAATAHPAAASRLGGAETREVLAALAADIIGEPVILVLDNCDRVAAEIAADVSELLARCPQLVIVATSRHALALYQECLLQVAPLAWHSAPGDCPSKTPPAIRLLRNSIGTRHRSATGCLDAALLGEIAAELGGVPMALELAASSIGRIGARRTLDRIISGQPLLPAPFVDTPLRHRTIRDCVEWGPRHLDDAATELLLHISLSSAVADLEDVLLLSGEHSELIEERLAMLVDHSLLDHTADGDGHYRYTMSGLTRTYCRQLLHADPERRERTRLFREQGLYRVAASIARMLEDPERRPAATVLIDRWLTDLRATIDQLIARDAPGRAVRMLSLLEDVWVERGLLTAAEASVASILHVDDSRAEDIALGVRCRAVLGRWALRSGRFRDAVALLEQAAADFHEDEPGLGHRLARQLAAAYHETGDHEQARAQLARARREPPTADSRTLIDIAEALTELAETSSAGHENWSDIRDRAMALPHRQDRLTVLNMLGRTLLRVNAPHRALETFHEALRTPRPAEHLLEMIGALEGCVSAYHAAGTEYSEQIHRLRAAARWIRDAYALPQPADPMFGISESRSETDDPAMTALDSVHDIDTAIAYALSAPLLSAADIDSPVSRLTKRQLEIAHLVAEGMTNRMIATRLGIAEWTVVNHLRQVMTKLDCPSRTHVALVIERETQQSA